MKKWAEALTIFSAYTQSEYALDFDDKYPTEDPHGKDYPHLDHHVITIEVDPQIVSKEDITRLNELGFKADIKNNQFVKNI